MEAQEARIVAAYENALRLMQSGAAADAQVVHLRHPCLEVWQCCDLRLCARALRATAADVTRYNPSRAVLFFDHRTNCRRCWKSPCFLPSSRPTTRPQCRRPQPPPPLARRLWQRRSSSWL